MLNLSGIDLKLQNLTFLIEKKIGNYHNVGKNFAESFKTEFA